MKLTQYIPTFRDGEHDIYSSDGVPSSTDGFNTGDKWVDTTTGTWYQFDGSSWNDVSSIRRTTSNAPGRSTAIPYTETVTASGSFFDGNANTLFEIPAATVVESIRILITDGVGSAATCDIGTNNAAGVWLAGNNDPDGFVAALDIENAGAYDTSLLDEANQPALGISGALAQADGGEIIITSAGDYSSSNVSLIVTVRLTPINPAAFN
jgi:hypothetical protein